jgi:1,4-dihydroxy-2-naphthoyl-CoA hydrolase
MAIWFKKNLELKDFVNWNKNTMTEYIGLEFTEIGDDYISATLPVDHRTQQPYGLLHGGASCVLAETMGSIASALVVDHQKYFTVGVEINANHVRSAKSGFVTGTCKPIKLGKNLHVWEIKITDEDDQLICISRLTVMIKSRK